MTAFDVQDVYARFGTRQVLREVNLAIGPGLWLVSGRNGSGKSTLLGLLAGEGAPVRGQVTFGGKPTRQPSVRTRIAYLRSVLDLDPRVSCRQQLDLRLGLAGLRPGARRSALTPLIERFALGAFIDRPPVTLSQGQRQSVALVGTLALPADALLLDEPLRGLDTARQAALLDLLAERSLQQPVVVVSHEGHRLTGRGAHALLMWQGRVLTEAASRVWLAESAARRFWVRLEGPEMRALAGAMAAAPGIGALWLREDVLRIECAEIDQVLAALEAAPAALGGAVRAFAHGAMALDDIVAQTPREGWL